MRSDLVVMAFAASQAIGPDRHDPLEDVVGVVDEQLVGDGLFRACFANELPLQLDRLADPGLRGLESLGDDLLGHLGAPSS